MNRVDPKSFFGGGGGGGGRGTDRPTIDCIMSEKQVCYLHNKKIFGQMTRVPRPPIIIKINDSAHFVSHRSSSRQQVVRWMKDIFRATLQINEVLR